MIAALFVDARGHYMTDPRVDPWPLDRDARTYAGTDPVIAHPPCARWCRLARLNERRYGHKVGDDGGCFASALASVRRCGGVLEHPAYSLAWKVDAFGLPRPSTRGGWTAPDAYGGRACHVEQGHYGHRARKATWLYAVRLAWYPDLVWGPSVAKAWVSWGDFDKYPDVPRLGKREALATPPAFRELLVALAGMVRSQA